MYTPLRRGFPWARMWDICRYSAMTAAGCTEAGEPLEASSGGLELMDGDVAFRGNFATVTEDMAVVDRRAGRISQGTEFLAQAVNGMVLSDGTRVLAKELTEHRLRWFSEERD